MASATSTENLESAPKWVAYSAAGVVGAARSVFCEEELLTAKGAKKGRRGRQVCQCQMRA
jgi:hypothetical protein